MWNPKLSQCLTHENPLVSLALGMDLLSMILCCRPNADLIQYKNITTVIINPISSQNHATELRKARTPVGEQGPQRPGRMTEPWEVPGTPRILGPNLGNHTPLKQFLHGQEDPPCGKIQEPVSVVIFVAPPRSAKTLGCHFEPVQDSSQLSKHTFLSSFTGARLSLPSHSVLSLYQPQLSTLAHCLPVMIRLQPLSKPR